MVLWEDEVIVTNVEILLHSLVDKYFHYELIQWNKCYMLSGCSILIINQSTNKVPVKQQGDQEEASIRLPPKKDWIYQKSVS